MAESAGDSKTNASSLWPLPFLSEKFPEGQRRKRQRRRRRQKTKPRIIVLDFFEGQRRRRRQITKPKNIALDVREGQRRRWWQITKPTRTTQKEGGEGSSTKEGQLAQPPTRRRSGPPALLCHSLQEKGVLTAFTTHEETQGRRKLTVSFHLPWSPRREETAVSTFREGRETKLKWWSTPPPRGRWCRLPILGGAAFSSLLLGCRRLRR